jgi:hypothetical protein
MKRSYQYAGLQNATQEGLSVDQCAARIHRFAYTAERLMFLQAAHIISTPERDVKVLLARLQYEASQHASQFKARLPELRVSKTKAYQDPDASLQAAFDEAMYAANTIELLAGLTKVFIPALLDAYQRYVNETNGLADYPTVRLLKTVIAEVDDGLRLLEAAYDDVVDTPEKEAEAEDWSATLRNLLAAAGDIDGTGKVNRDVLRPVRATAPYLIPKALTRDDTFPRVWDIIHVENERVEERLMQMIATRLGETTIAEALGFVLYEMKDQPWEFYADISRHLWDEMRHSVFGEAAAEDIFDNRSTMPIRDWESAYLFRMDPLELYAMLFGVEAGLMKYPPGKREEFEFCRDTARHPLMTTLQDFDWADEVLHVHIARRRLKEWFDGSPEELQALGQKGLDFRARARAMHPQSPLPDASGKIRGPQ